MSIPTMSIQVPLDADPLESECGHAGDELVGLRVELEASRVREHALRRRLIEAETRYRNLAVDWIRRTEAPK